MVAVLTLQKWTGLSTFLQTGYGDSIARKVMPEAAALLSLWVMWLYEEWLRRHLPQSDNVKFQCGASCLCAKKYPPALYFSRRRICFVEETPGNAVQTDPPNRPEGEVAVWSRRYASRSILRLMTVCNVQKLCTFRRNWTIWKTCAQSPARAGVFFFVITSILVLRPPIFLSSGYPRLCGIKAVVARS